MTSTCWFHDPLVLDIHEYLRQKESKLPVYHAQSPQLSSRRYLVDWLAIVAEKFDLCACSKHLAISLLDYFMDQYCITEPQLKLVVLGCLLIACKMEEQEINIPKSSTLNQFVNAPGYTARDYLNIELMLLQSFAWRLDYPTAAHFIEYYLCCSVSSSDLHHDKPLHSKCDMARDYVRRYCTYFLEVSLQDHFYRGHAPSLVAASCIMSSRVCLGISPVWTPQLRKVTRYSCTELQQVVTAMLRTHKMDAQESSPSSTASETPSNNNNNTVTSPASTDQGYDSLMQTPDASPEPEPDCFITDDSDVTRSASQTANGSNVCSGSALISSSSATVSLNSANIYSSSANTSSVSAKVCSSNSSAFSNGASVGSSSSKFSNRQRANSSLSNLPADDTQAQNAVVITLY